MLCFHQWGIVLISLTVLVYIYCGCSYSCRWIFYTSREWVIDSTRDSLFVIINTDQLMNPSYWKGRQSGFANRWMPKTDRNEQSAPCSVKIARKSSYSPWDLQHDDSLYSWQTIMAKSLSRPFALFAHEPIIQLLGIYMAYLYGLLYRK